MPLAGPFSKRMDREGLITGAFESLYFDRKNLPFVVMLDTLS
jgi:hypothetical protein